MIPFPYKYVAALVVVGASLGGAFVYGHHTATVAAERDALERDAIARHKFDALTIALRDADLAIITEQKRVAQIKRVEIIKYVDKYRTVVREVPHVVECVNDSGLLDLINSTTPTAAAE